MKKQIIAGLVALVSACSELPKNEKLHRIWEENGVMYGQKGVIFLVDKKGIPYSFGFHSITQTEGGYHAEVGACEYELDKKGQLVKAPSLECEEGLTEYYEIIQPMTLDPPAKQEDHSHRKKFMQYRRYLEQQKEN